MEVMFGRKPKPIATKEYKISVTKSTWVTVRAPGIVTKQAAMKVAENFYSPIKWDTKLKVLSVKEI
jgi:hypothetical protein